MRREPERKRRAKSVICCLLAEANSKPEVSRNGELSRIWCHNCYLRPLPVETSRCSCQQPVIRVEDAHCDLRALAAAATTAAALASSAANHDKQQTCVCEVAPPKVEINPPIDFRPSPPGDFQQHNETIPSAEEAFASAQ